MRRNTVKTARTQLKPWQRKVAHATPATPMPKNFTNRISIRIFAEEDRARNKNGDLESPSAEKIPLDTL